MGRIGGKIDKLTGGYKYKKRKVGVLRAMRKALGTLNIIIARKGMDIQTLYVSHVRRRDICKEIAPK